MVQITDAHIMGLASVFLVGFIGSLFIHVLDRNTEPNYVRRVRK